MLGEHGWVVVRAGGLAEGRPGEGTGEEQFEVGGTSDKLRAVWGEHGTPRGTSWRMERQRMGPCVETRRRNCGQGGVVSPAFPALPESPGWRQVSPLYLRPSPPDLTLSRRWSVGWEQPGSVCWARAGGGFGKTCLPSVCLARPLSDRVGGSGGRSEAEGCSALGAVWFVWGAGVEVGRVSVSGSTPPPSPLPPRWGGCWEVAYLEPRTPWPSLDGDPRNLPPRPAARQAVGNFAE